MTAEKAPTARETCNSQVIQIKARRGDAAVLVAAVEAAIETSRNTLDSSEEGAWKPDNKHDPETSVEVIKPRNAFPGADKDTPRFSSLWCIYQNHGQD